MTFVQANEQWLGAVPADWPSSCIRNVAQFSPGYSDGSATPDELCTVVPMELLSQDEKTGVSSLRAFEDITGGLTLFEAGDVLSAKITPCMENGKGAFVESLPTRYAFGSTEFHVLRSVNAYNLWTLQSEGHPRIGGDLTSLVPNPYEADAARQVVQLPRDIEAVRRC